MYAGDGAVQLRFELAKLLFGDVPELVECLYLLGTAGI